MDKLNEQAVRLLSLTTVALSDRAGFVRHMARHYPDEFDRVAVRMTMGLSVATFVFAAGSMRVEVASGDPGDHGILKGIIAYQIQNWPGGEPASVIWTGDGAGSPVLPHFRAMRLVRRDMITPRLCRIELAGDDLFRFARGGWHVRLLFPPDGRTPVWPHAGPGALPVWPQGADRLTLRTYTLRHVRPEAGRVAIDVVMHEPAGRATEWVRLAPIGTPLGMMGPGGGEVAAAEWVCMAGDETALPAIARALETLPPATRGHAVIEVEDAQDEQPLVVPQGISLHWIHRDGAPAGQSTRLVDTVQALDWPQGGDLFAFSGTEFSAYKTLRHEFRKVRSLKRKEHLAMAYWRRGLAEGATG